MRIEDIPGDNMILFMENLISNLLGVNKNELLAFIGCLFSEIWQQRNAHCIDNVPVNPSFAMARVEKANLELQNFPICNRGGAIENDPVIDCLEAPVIPLRPREEEVRHVFFTDASWVLGEAGIATIRVDTSTGRWFVKSQKIRSQSALEAEFRLFSLLCLGLSS
ncbi:hypothetical protein CsatA_012406 [Cannabis sativa]